MSHGRQQKRVDCLRAVPLPSVLRLCAAQPDRYDRHKWHTPKGALSLTGAKFMNWTQGVGGGGAIDLVIQDQSRVGTVYFMMSEDNVRKKVGLPWVSFCSDAASLAPEGVFLESNPHPRAYGSFARLLGKYVRDEGVIPLEEAVRRLTSLPAEQLSIRRRGQLRAGYFADVVIFDPATIQDHATFAEPHQYATGVLHVFVNGDQVIRDGEHTGATPGRVVRGPGWTGWGGGS